MIAAIVGRLRLYAKVFGLPECIEAADEIERLSAALMAAQASAGNTEMQTAISATLVQLTAENKALRAESERDRAAISRVEAVCADFEGMTGAGYRYMAENVRAALSPPPQ
jgi:hypothetical protein